MDIIPHVVEDLFLVKLLSDGSVVRLDESIFFSKEVKDDGAAVWKDCLFDENQNLHLRLYKPRSPTTNLPILYFLHGGAFCCGSRTSPNFHNCCLRLASVLQVLLVAPDHRLAPEHRIPAAFEDTMTSLTWLRDQALLADAADVWLRGGNVDYGRVFVMGDSSGGNMAHHLAVEIGPGSPGLDPLRVRGYVLMAPFFGGTVRTKSEEEPTDQVLFSADTFERAWRMSLPSGSSPDDTWANPFGPSSPKLDSVKLDPILVLVGGREVMKDRIEDYYKKMKEMGKEIEYVEFEGKEHGFLVNHPFSEVANAALQSIHQFMSKN